MTIIKELISNSELRKYVSFFEFYYYVIKRSPKRYNISLSDSIMNYLSILMTPFVLWIISMVVFLIVGHGWATFLFVGLGAILILNFVFTRSVLDEAYEIERKLKEKRREIKKQKERKKLQLDERRNNRLFY